MMTNRDLALKTIRSDRIGSLDKLEAGGGALYSQRLTAKALRRAVSRGRRPFLSGGAYLLQEAY